MESSILAKENRNSAIKNYFVNFMYTIKSHITMKYQSFMKVLTRYSVIINFMFLVTLILMCCYEVSIFIVVLFATISLAILFKINESLNLE